MLQEMSTSLLDYTCNSFQFVPLVHDPIFSAIATRLPIIILIYLKIPRM